MENVTSYTDHHETDILAVIDHEGTAYCVDHAVKVLFAGDIEAFEDVDSGRDTSFVDLQGNKFELVHEMSVSYADSDDAFYPEGLYCEYGDCGAELIPPQESDE